MLELLISVAIASVAGAGASRLESQLPGVARSSASGDVAPRLLLGREGGEMPGQPLFSRGSWIATTYASAALGSEAGELYAGHVGIGYHLLDDFSLNLEGIISHVEVNDMDEAAGGAAIGGGASLVFRWHVLENEEWSLYFDGGSGVMHSSGSYPAAGTHVNFASQFGVGATRALSERVLVMGGLRWLHISNADLHGEDENPGADHALVYLGLMIPL